MKTGWVATGGCASLSKVASRSRSASGRPEPPAREGRNRSQVQHVAMGGVAGEALGSLRWRPSQNLAPARTAFRSVGSSILGDLSGRFGFLWGGHQSEDLRVCGSSHPEHGLKRSARRAKYVSSFLGGRPSRRSSVGSTEAARPERRRTWRMVCTASWPHERPLRRRCRA